MPRVMIVEDDLTILSNLSQLLQLTGLDVMEAHDGQEALRLLLECLVHDASLPKMIVSDLFLYCTTFVTARMLLFIVFKLYMSNSWR